MQAKNPAQISKDTGGTKSYNEDIYDSILERMNKYKDAVEYAKNELNDMKLAIKMLDEAEKLK